MRKRITQLLTAIAIAIVTSCEVMDVHPYAGNVTGETDINTRNAARIEQSLAGRQSFRFAVISDTQRWYDETEAEVASINARGDIDFVIHCGDITDFGVTDEYEWQREVLSGLTMPYVLLLGNHDCLGSGRNVWHAIWGPADYTFLAGDTRFICLNTNALEYDNSTPVPDFGYLDSFHGDTSAARTVVAMHAGPDGEQLPPNLSKYFGISVRALNAPLFCLYGHGHSMEDSEPFDDGITYYQTTCAKDRQYRVFTITENGYTHETVTF